MLSRKGPVAKTKAPRQAKASKTQAPQVVSLTHPLLSLTPGTPVTWHPAGNTAPHHAMVIGSSDKGRIHIVDWTESKIVTKYVYPANLTKGVAGYDPFKE